MLDMDETVEWSSLYPLVMPLVPGCGAALIKDYLRRNAIQFFEKTQAWELELDAIPVVTGQAEYQLELEWDFCRIDKLAAVELGGMALSPGATDGYTAATPDVITLAVEPLADDADGLVVTVILKPTATAEEIPEELFNLYAEGIAAGALADLFAMPKKPWADPNQSVYRGGLFMQAIGKARIAKMLNHSNAAMTVRPQSAFM